MNKKLVVLMAIFCAGALFAQEPAAPEQNATAAPAAPMKTYTEKEARDEVNKAIKEKLIDASDMASMYEKINKGKAQEAVKEILKLREAKAGGAAPGDWPNYLGPNWNGESPETGLLKSWPEKGPKELWSAPIQIGWSCPSVAGDDVVLMQANNNGENNWNNSQNAVESVICLSAKDGKKKWQYDYKNADYFCGWWEGGPRATPTITAKYVYTLGMKGILSCLNRKSGALVWQINLNSAEIGLLASFGDVKGYAQSVVIINGVIVINLCSEDGREPTGCGYKVVGIDAENGKVLWEYKEAVKGKLAGGMPGNVSIADIGKEKCALTYVGAVLTAFRPSDGKVLWSAANAGLNRCGASLAPLCLYGKKALFTPVMWDQVAFMEINWGSPKPEVKTLWTSSGINFFCMCTPCVYHKGNVFGLETGDLDPNSWKDTFKIICLDGTTGALKWRSEPVQGSASLIAADGLLFVRYFKTLKLLEATSSGMVEKGKMENLHNATSKAFDGPALIDGVLPVISNGKLYLRLPDKLLCLDVKNK